MLLNALDAAAKGHKARVVFEGAATGLVPKLAAPGHPLHGLYVRTREAGLIAGACRACSQKTGVLEEVKQAGLALLDDMNGHPSMAAFMDRGYEIITF